MLTEGLSRDPILSPLKLRYFKGLRGLVGARGAQDERVGVERADDLQAGRQALGGEAAGYAGGRLADELPLADLPGAWNAGLEELLGVTPPNDRLGCLQDIHWYDGAWGYFPTYTLGAMSAAQLYAAARAAVPEIPEAIGRGDFAPLLGWLRREIHAKGSLHSTGELLTAATGRPLDPEIFKEHLAARYLA